MLIVLLAFNNITAHKLLIARCGVPSDTYSHKTNNNFEKLLDLEGTKNTLMITAPISLVLYMHIGPTQLLENAAFNAKFDAEKRLCPRFTGLDWDDSNEIEEAIATDKKDKDEEDPLKKNR